MDMAVSASFSSLARIGFLAAATAPLGNSNAVGAVRTDMKIYSRITQVVREGGLPLLVKKLWRRLRTTYLDFFLHEMPHGLPFVRVEIKEVATSPDDAAIARRTLASYHKAIEDEKRLARNKSYPDAWDFVKGKYHDDFSEILAAGAGQRFSFGSG